MPEVGRGEVLIVPDLSRFGRDLQRGIGTHIDAAGRSMEQTFGASAKRSAADVERAFAKTRSGIEVPITADTRGFTSDLRDVDDIAKRVKADVPVGADTAKLDKSVVVAAERAAKKAADELSRIPGGVDAETFRTKVAAAASVAARDAAARLSNIPAGVDAGSLAKEVAAEAARAAKNADVDVPVGADTSAFRRLPDEVRPHVKRAGAEMERSFSDSATKSAKAVAGAIGVTLGVGIGKELLELGNQTAVFRQKTKTVFEDSTDDVQRWAKENNRALGLTEARLAGVAANFGDLLKPMGFTSDEAAKMSTRVIGLAGALSAWSGGTRSVVDVSESLSKAMLGEREELKGLGISIAEADVNTRLLAKNQGHLTGATRQQAEATATMELIFEKSTDAQKAWADGSFEAIQRQNELRAKVAELTQSLAEGLLPIVDKTAAALTAIPTPVITATAALAGIGVAAVGVSKVADAVGNLHSRAVDLAATHPGIGRVGGSLARLGGTAAAIGAASIGLETLADQVLRLEFGAAPNLSKLTNELVRFAETGKPAGELAREFGNDFTDLADKLTKVEGKVSDKGLGDRVKNILEGANLIGSRAGVKDAQRDIEALDKSLTELVSTGNKAVAADLVGRIARDAGVPVERLTAQLDGYTGALADVDTQQRLAGRSGADLGNGTRHLGEQVARAQEEMARYSDALRDAYGASQSLLGTQISVADAVKAVGDAGAEVAAKERELAEAVRIHGRASTEAQAASNALESARRRQLSDIDALAQANVRLADLQATAAGKVLTDAEKYARYRDELIRLKDTIAPGSPLRTHLEGLINSLPPPEVKAKVLLDTAEAEAKARGLLGVLSIKPAVLERRGSAGVVGVMHEGGRVQGPTREVPILAEQGEYVMQRSAVDALGVDTLDALNRYHDGGLVSKPVFPTLPAASTVSTLPPLALDAMMGSIEPLPWASNGATGGGRGNVVINGGINLTGVRDGDQALTRLPTALRSELFLAGY